MASLYIVEYVNQPIIAGQAVAAGDEPPVAEQKVAIGGVSAASAAFNAKTRFLEIHTDVICSYKVGANPTAADTNMRMAADTNKYFGVRPGDKIAVITNT